MKKFLSATILLSTFIATGCGEDSTQTSGEKIFRYGTVAYGVAMENAGIDPHESYSGWSTIRYGVGETLFRFNEKMELEPWIADSYEFVDEFTLKITLRDDVNFSNGKKVTGEAVKKCLDDLLARHDRAPKDLKVESITADGQSVTIRSTEKLPALLNYLSDPYGVIIDVDEGVKDRIVIGTGPYVAEKVTDTQIDLLPNKNYWGKVKPKLDKIIVKSITDGDTLTMAMQNGELDAVQGLPYSSLQLFRDNPKFKLSQTDTSRIYQIAFNFDTPALQDEKVRRAICMAVDKENFTKILLSGNGTSAIGPFPANMSFGDNTVHAPKFNLDDARKLLDEAGWKDSDGDGIRDKDGKNLELKYLTYTSRQELPLLAESTQATLKEIGIKLNVNATDNYKTFLRDRDFDLYSKAIVTAPTGDPEYYFTSHIVPGAVDNAGNYNSSEIVALEDQLRNTYGAEDRSQIAIKMSQQILDDSALCYASHLKMTFVMKPNVEGFSAHPSDYYEIQPELDLK